MALSNSEQEMIWVEAWNDLSDIIKKYPDGYILLPEYRITDMNGAEEWIQKKAYENNLIQFSIVLYKGKESIIISSIDARH